MWLTGFPCIRENSGNVCTACVCEKGSTWFNESQLNLRLHARKNYASVVSNPYITKNSHFYVVFFAAAIWVTQCFFPGEKRCVTQPGSQGRLFSCSGGQGKRDAGNEVVRDEPKKRLRG